MMQMIRKLILLLCLGWVLPLQAQNEPTPYEIALQRIEGAAETGATVLDLSYMKLTELPPEIGQLTQLQVLSLDSNQLASLPAEIGQLSSLHIFYLHDNQLSSLPAEIGQLSSLRELHLSNKGVFAYPTEKPHRNRSGLIFLQ